MNEARIGLRKFAEMVDMQASNLSDIERGKKAPPAAKAKIEKICDTLGLAKSDSRRIEMFDLAAKYGKRRIPADVADSLMKPGVPVLVRTVANRQLSERKLRELAKYIEDNY